MASSLSDIIALELLAVVGIGFGCNVVDNIIIHSLVSRSVLSCVVKAATAFDGCAPLVSQFNSDTSMLWILLSLLSCVVKESRDCGVSPSSTLLLLSVVGHNCICDTSKSLAFRTLMSCVVKHKSSLLVRNGCDCIFDTRMSLLSRFLTSIVKKKSSPSAFDILLAVVGIV